MCVTAWMTACAGCCARGCTQAAVAACLATRHHTHRLPPLLPTLHSLIATPASTRTCPPGPDPLPPCAAPPQAHVGEPHTPHGCACAPAGGMVKQAHDACQHLRDSICHAREPREESLCACPACRTLQHTRPLLRGTQGCMDAFAAHCTARWHYEKPHSRAAPAAATVLPTASCVTLVPPAHLLEPGAS